MYNQAAYDQFVNEAKEVKQGTRGWISLTRASKACGVPKGQLQVVCQALGLHIDNTHGRYGMCATRSVSDGSR